MTTTTYVATANCPDGSELSVTIGSPFNITKTVDVAGDVAQFDFTDAEISGVDSVQAVFSITVNGVTDTETITMLIRGVSTELTTIANLLIANITSSQAFITFDIDPIVNVAVEINDGSGYVSISDTGVYASHNYSIHNQISLAADTSYTIRLTPVGEASQTITFTTQEAVNDPRFVSLVFETPTTTQLNLITTYTVDSFHRYRYRESGSTVDQYSNEDTSGIYDEHTLDITGLTAGTTYEVWPQTSDDGGVTWFDVTGSAFTGSTAASTATGSYIELVESDWTSGNSTAGDNAEHGSNWTGSNGFLADSGSTDAWRVKVGQDENLGATRIWEGFPAGTKEAIFRYRFFLPADYQTFWDDGDQNIKMPGMAAEVSAANGGYGGSTSSIYAHDKRAWSYRGMMHRPSSTYVTLGTGAEKYWQGSSNTVSGNEYGDAIWNSPTGSASSATPFIAGQWNEYHQRIKMNDYGVANGEVEVLINGSVETLDTGFEWTKNAAFLEIFRIWFDVYHGGTDKVTAGDLYMFFRQFEYQIIA